MPHDQRRLRFAVESARDAARATLSHFGRLRGSHIERKSDGSEVTVADREAEEHLRRQIADAFPGDGILGEEFDPKPSDTGWRWVIDPIDGTYSFVRGIPLYTTLLAAERLGERGEPVPDGVRIGVIVAPALDEVVFAERGAGAWHIRGDAEPVPARVGSARTLAEASVATTSIDYFDASDTRDVFDRVADAAGHTRGWPDAYAAMLLATGRCDAIVEPAIKAWDVAPMQPIVIEAGGQLTDWSGVPTVHHSTLVASNGLIHAEVLSVLARAGDRG